jgi:hypothetical protein
MQAEPFSAGNLTGSLDYLQRIGFNPIPLPANPPLTTAPPALRRLLHVGGIGRMEKLLPPNQPNQRQAGGQPGEPEQAARMLSEDVLTGLYGYKIPLAFLVLGEPGGVAIYMGVWSPFQRENASAATLDHRGRILGAVLGSLYPAIKLAPVKEVQLPTWQWSGLALGIPTAKPPEALDNALPLDRMIRALSDASWAFLVLAEPVVEQEISKLRNAVINETRDILTAYPTTTGGIPNPLAQHYTELLKQALQALTQGQTLGAWRTAAYLLGDGTSYYRLASLWRGIFSGDQSVLDPVRVWDSADVAALANNWAMPEIKGPAGYGHYRHPFQYQTLLTSAQLAAYVHLPQLETGGFTVELVPDFDAVPPLIQTSDALTLGKVVPQHQALTPPEAVPGKVDYKIKAADLTSHVFVAGVTGGGKSNTIFYLLKEAAKLRVPFLVIEPAKAEYRALLNEPNLANRLQIFTLGNENISPFRVNPFEVLAGTPVSVHLDLLRSVFGASFGMWTPLPQVLEQCLHRVYEDRGWDLAANTNARLDNRSDIAAAFPTLSDLVTKVDIVTRQLGYEERITADIRAALITRLNGLRAGGKGRMLDVKRSLPMRLLLNQPTILELEGMGDDDDKAFLMGLLLIQLVEYRQEEHRQTGGKVGPLRHLLVIEEAHRLLTNVARQGREEEANPRGKAVETFANLLSEIRAYGQGIIIADQIPVKLAPEVIKNTNLKIVHRTVAADDREVLAGAMAMDEHQAKALATFRDGRAAVFSKGDDTPVLVQMAKAKDQEGQTIPGNQQVASSMAAMRAQQKLQAYFLSSPGCTQACLSASSACQEARQLVEDPALQATFARLVLSTIEDTEALERLWPELLSVVRAKRLPKSNEPELLRCLMGHAAYWFADHRGAQAGWTYAETEQLADTLRKVLLSKLANENTGPARSQFQQHARQQHARTYAPFPACERICQQQPPVCLYRYAVADLVATGRHGGAWRTAVANDAKSQDGRYRETWAVSRMVGSELIEFPEDAWPDPVKQKVGDGARRTSLCYAQQALAKDSSKTLGTARKIMEKLLTEAT